jgi:hypothetical protein
VSSAEQPRNDLTVSTKPFSPTREETLKPSPDTNIEIKQRGSVMLASILSFFYQHSCRKYLAAVRRYRELNDRWT